MHEGVAIIPLPARSRSTGGCFVIGRDCRLQADPVLASQAKYLAAMFDRASTFSLPTNPFTPNDHLNNTITFRMKDDVPAEGYELSVTPTSVSIAASEPAGAFYAVQTIRQLIDPLFDDPTIEPKRSEWRLPCVEVTDQPRFSWRGFMLDVGRHFFEKEVIMRIIDAMAAIKLNVFHWHLTDDQGWRIEIKRYPDLVNIGSKRNNTQTGGYISWKRSGKPHEGHYTQDDAKGIVAYAQDRFITVVPEIDMPGHFSAGLAAYPEYSCKGVPLTVPVTFGIKKDVVCIGKERSFDFLRDVIDELLATFPSKVIHIGGDETPTERWKHCPDCTKRVEDEGLHTARGLQPYFTRRIEDMLAQRGRSLMGWNEVLSSNLGPSTIIQFWKGRTGSLLPHLARGQQCVMSPFFRVYIDHDYVLLPLDEIYSYDPVPKGLPVDLQRNVLGIETPLWTEWVRDTRRLFWQLFPRLLAVAETGWTPACLKDYASFKARTRAYYPRLEMNGMAGAPIEKTERCKLRKPLSILHLFLEPNVPREDP